MNAVAVSHQHQMRVDVLDTVARLAGFTENLHGRLPDGRMPDVLRTALPSRSVFLGDAKATETPWDPGTRRRLARYMSWMRRNCLAWGPGGVFALCVGPEVDALYWALLIEELTRATGLEATAARCRALDPSTVVVWVYPVADRPSSR